MAPTLVAPNRHGQCLRRAITATDDGAGNLTDVQTITVTVTNILDIPVITSNGGAIPYLHRVDENIATVITTVVADVTANFGGYIISGGDDAPKLFSDKDMAALPSPRPRFRQSL